jgi:hypothetical protein
MARIELFVLFGLLVGIPIGVLGSHFVRMYFAWRDSRVLRVRVKANLQENISAAHTDTLLDELSKRDDLIETRRNR